MASARNTDELARLLWANGLDRWFAANPTWALGRPVLDQRSLTLVALAEDGRQVCLRVEDQAGALAVSSPTQDAPAIADELARVVESAARRGLRLEPDRARRLPVVNPGPSMIPGRRMELFIASGCDLHCYFCCESERIAQKYFMPWEELRAKLTEAARSGVEVVQFMGGEATLHPRFIDALALARELGLGTYVITNLLRWQQRRFAEDAGPLLDEVMISMHAYGPEAGRAVTGVRSWWETFGQAAANARDTLQGRIRCSTVLTRSNVADLERIADVQLRFRPHAWIMGNAVPVVGTREDVVDGNLTLTETIAMRPRLEALSARCREAGCHLVFFAVPQCVLGPTLWDDAHDLWIGDQDLGDGAPQGVEDVTFWSRADYLDRPGAVTLGRTRTEPCSTCTRRSGCGGHYSAYFERHGAGELRPVEEGAE